MAWSLPHFGRERANIPDDTANIFPGMKRHFRGQAGGGYEEGRREKVWDVKTRRRETRQHNTIKYDKTQHKTTTRQHKTTTTRDEDETRQDKMRTRDQTKDNHKTIEDKTGQHKTKTTTRQEQYKTRHTNLSPSPTNLKIKSLPAFFVCTLSAKSPYNISCLCHEYIYCNKYPERPV